MSVSQQLSSFNNQIPPRYAIKSITKAYRITGADYGQILNCSGTTSYTLSTVPAASVGAGFNCWVWNSSTTTAFALTIDPNGSETIDVNSTLILRPGEGTEIVSDGANWQTVAKKTMVFYAENGTAGTTSISHPVATGASSVAIGGGGAAASAINAFAIGVSAGATGSASFALGYFASASGANSYGLGNSANASGSNSFAFNNNSSALQTYKYAYGGPPSGTTAAQFGFLPLIATTTDTTPTVLCSEGGVAASSANQLILPNSSAFTFSILVTARQQAAGGTASAAWKIEGLIRREASAATTTLVASTTTIISNVPAWSISVSADTTLGGLTITATGAAATSIFWQAVVQTSEITYA